MGITTKLVKDGNSVAVRLPKVLLEMSGLRGSVQLVAKKGQIIIKQTERHPREGWEDQIKKVLRDEAHIKDDDFSDMNAATTDPWDELEPWSGPTYEEWLKQNAKK